MDDNFKSNFIIYPMKTRIYQDGVTIGLTMVYLLVMDAMIKIVVNIPVFERYSVIFNICFVLTIAFLMAMVNIKHKYWISIFLGLTMGIYGFAQIAHYQVFSTFFSLSKISMLSELIAVSTGAATVMNFTSFQMVIPCVILLFLLWLNHRFLPINPHIHHSRKVMISWMSALVCMIGGCGFTIASYPDYPVHVRSYEYLYERLYNKTLSVRYFGIYSYLGKDFYNSFISQNHATEAMVQQYLSTNGYHGQTNEYTGLFKGKNLILILAESFSAYSLDPLVTPNLYQMRQEGIYFANHYAPLFDANTADSEFIALTGAMPSTEGSTTPNHYFSNTYDNGLAHFFKDEGYTPLSFHSWNRSFYHRDVLHPSYGFDHYYANESLDLTTFDGWTSAYNWPLDTELFDQAYQLTDTSQPFMDFIISATSHMPYQKNRKELSEEISYMESVLPENTNSEILVYDAALHNLDKAIGNLINALQDDGVLEDTVIVVFGDHYPYGMSEQGQSIYFDGKTKYEKYRTPWLIYTPGLEARTITRTTSTFDIYPTLANLFGFDIDDQLVFGVDALDDTTKGIVYFPDYSWLDDHAYYDASSATTLLFDDVYDDTTIDRLCEQSLTALQVGQAALAVDEFKLEKE